MRDLMITGLEQAGINIFSIRPMTCNKVWTVGAGSPFI